MKTKTVKARRSVRFTKKMLLAIELQQLIGEALISVQVPDEWCPMLYGSSFYIPVPADAGDDVDVADDAGDENGDIADEEQMVFSHTANKTATGITYTRSFSSVQDFIKQPFANPKNEALWRSEEQPGGKYRDWRTELLRDDLTHKNETWYGAKTGEESVQHALKGWPEGAERVRKLLSDIEAPAPVDIRRRLNRGDQGDELDVHQVYRGNLDHAWTRRRRTSVHTRMNARVVVPLGGSKMQMADEMFWRGAAVIKLTELLEEAGYRIELLASDMTLVDGHSVSVCNSFCMKEAGEQLDIERVAGVICNAGFARTIGFRSTYAAMDQAARDTVYDKSGGKTIKRTLLSRSYKWHEKATRAMGLENDKTLTFEVPDSVDNRSRAEEWVRKCLVKLNATEQEAA